jgi:3-dehydroquinate synthase
MQTIYCNLKEKHPIYIDNGLLNTALLIDYCLGLGSTIVIIADEKISAQYAEPLVAKFNQAKIIVHLLKFTANENNKSRETKQELEDKILALGCGRDTCLIAVGGGITSDMVGFVAATYCRGIPVVYVPTTLLAMVDASIGGKTGVNTPQGKNLIGAFYQPKAVFIDPKVLTTLAAEEITNGMAEVIKYAIIKDAAFFAFIQNHQQDSWPYIISVCCQLKKSVIELDEKEQGIRQILNFGHTIGHALEKAAAHKVSHGAAVALGMVAASYISVRLNYLDLASFEKIVNILKAYHLPVAIKNIAKEEIKKFLLLDKKNKNRIPHFVLIDGIGKVHAADNYYSEPLTAEIIEEGLNKICLP